MLRNLVLLTCMACFTSMSLSAQGGWTRAMDGFFVQVAVSTFSSSTFYDENGMETELSNQFSSQNLLLYGEYGINGRLDMLINVPLVKFQRYDITETAIGPGDLRIGLKYRLLKNFPLSFSIEAEIPTASNEKIVAFSDPNQTGELFNLPTSDGEYNYWFTLVGSKGNRKGDMYGTLYGAVNMRTEGFSNQLQLGGEVGKQFGSAWLIAKLKIQDKLGDSDFTDSVFLFGEQTTFTEVAFTGFLKISDHLSFTTTVAQQLGFLKSLNNVTVGPNISFGVAVEY